MFDTDYKSGERAGHAGLGCSGLAVDLTIEGMPFPLGAAAELIMYRIVQEALTNTLRHAAARHAAVAIVYDRPQVRIRVTDDGSARAAGTQHSDGGPPGHGIDGMRERAALHGGTLRAGPNPDTPEGWLVEATLRFPGRS